MGADEKIGRLVLGLFIGFYALLGVLVVSGVGEIVVCSARGRTPTLWVDRPAPVDFECRNQKPKK